MNKLAIRTEKQLINRKKNFQKIVDILNDMKVSFFLEGGVLLGAIRDNNFIKWDWDVEIALFSNDFNNKFNDILKKLKSEGFEVLNYNNSFHHLKINVFKYDDPKISTFSLFGWTYNNFNKCYVRKDIKIPKKYLIDMKKISFLDRNVLVPTPPEDYLEFKYGDWKKPLKSSDKVEYLTKKHYKRNSLNLALNIDKLIKKFF